MSGQRAHVTGLAAWLGRGGLALAILVGLPGAASAQHWRGTWGASPQTTLEQIPTSPITDFKGKTIRQVVRISAGGDRVRLRFSNELSSASHVIGRVTVALAGPSGTIDPATLRDVTFGGSAQGMMASNAPLVSDPIDMPVQPKADLAVTIYFPEQASALTAHGSAYTTAWVVDGDQARANSLGTGLRFMHRVAISGVDVETRAAAPVIVALGDSITDGTRSTVDANRRWPDKLAERLTAAGKTGHAVVNAGIGGNRVLRPSRSPSALARFDRDVLSVPGASHLIVLEGVNDLGNMAREGHRVTAADLIAGYRQIIQRGHGRGIKVYLATIIPYKGAGYWTAEGEAVRQAVNTWIRIQKDADGFFDFSRAMARATDPDRMKAEYDTGDALHPNDAGMQAMAEAVDLNAF